MRNLIKTTTILGALVLGVSTTGVAVNAAPISSGDTTTAKVGLTSDETDKVTLTNAPNIDFGSQKIGTEPLTLHAANVDDNITVSNPGLGAGWIVTLSSTPFTDGEKTLNNAELSFAPGTVKSEEDDNQSTAPTGAAITSNGADQTIFSALPNTGIGIWNNTYANEDITLDIPAGNLAGNYTSILTWTLTDGPAS
ncbi:WxL domain-containing protein [Companilactobacillus sp. HBUAS59699]|uniref:WxL domain-containing protein n=1 Tax=Companilactobacillus sp. HBUAS59699 TaxID=3109358 RepID=UPI002FF0BFA2